MSAATPRWWTPCALNEIRLAEWEIAQIRERYAVFSKESLYQAIQDGEVAGHPAWEDCIAWSREIVSEGLRRYQVR